MKIAILGCGPEGIFAAEAAHQRGHDYDILAPKQAAISEVQFLMTPIPCLTSPRPEGEITLFKQGDRDGYADKVNGNMAMDVDWDTFDAGKRPMWSMRNAYTAGWIAHHENIEDFRVLPGDMADMLTGYDLVVNTGSLKALCANRRHKFDEQVIYTKQEPIFNRPNQVWYNGDKSVDWFRWTIVNGISVYEFSKKPFVDKATARHIVEDYRPTTTNCDCHPGMFRMGRMGAWDRHQRPETVYFEMLKVLDG